MLFGVLVMNLHVFMSVRHLVMGWANKVSACACTTTLLCILVLRLFICLFVKHERRWRQLSFRFNRHKSRSVEMSCLGCNFLW